MHCEPSRFAPVSRRAFLSSGLAAAGVPRRGLRLRPAAVAAVDTRPIVAARAVERPVRVAPTAAFRLRDTQRAKLLTTTPVARPGRRSPLAGRQGRAPSPDTNLYKDGLPKGRGIYVVDAGLPEPASGRRQSPRAANRCRSRSRSMPQPTAPIVGAAAPRAAVAHPREHAGRQPDLHPRPACARCTTCRCRDVIGTGQAGRRDVRHARAVPVAVLRSGARPAARRSWRRTSDGVTFVHVEIYTPTAVATRVADRRGMGTAERAVVVHHRRHRDDRVPDRRRVRQQRDQAALDRW